MSGVIDKIAHALHLDKSSKKHHEDNSAAPTAETAAVKQAAFDSNKVTVIFVLGGPGAGTRQFFTL